MKLNVRSSAGMPGRGDAGGKSARSTMTSRFSARRCVTRGLSKMRISGSAPPASAGPYDGVSPHQRARPRMNPTTPLATVSQTARRCNLPAPQEEQSDRQQDDDALPDGHVKQLKELAEVFAQPEEHRDAKRVED